MIPTTNAVETTDSEPTSLKKINAILAGASDGTLPLTTTAEITTELGPTNTLLGKLETKVSGAGFGTVTTAGAVNYTALTSQACNYVEIVNDTGVDINVQRGGAGAAFTMKAGASYATAKRFWVSANASELAVKLAVAGTDKTMSYEWMSLTA